MIQAREFKRGDLILYDRFGSQHESLSPSFDPEDFGIGVIVKIHSDVGESEDDLYAEVMKDDGKRGFFSLSYLTSVNFISDDCNASCRP